MRHYVHDRHSWNFPNSSLEIFVASCHNVASVLLDSINNAVVSIGSLMIAFKPFEPGILWYSQGNSVFDSEFLKFGNNAIGDIGNALPQKTIHRCLEDVQFVLNAKVDEISVDKDTVGWTQSIVVGEEHTRRFFGSLYIGLYIYLTSTSSAVVFSITSFLLRSCSSYFALFSFLTRWFNTASGLGLRSSSWLMQICWLFFSCPSTL